MFLLHLFRTLPSRSRFTSFYELCIKIFRSLFSSFQLKASPQARFWRFYPLKNIFCISLLTLIDRNLCLEVVVKTEWAYISVVVCLMKLGLNYQSSFWYWSLFNNFVLRSSQATEYALFTDFIVYTTSIAI